MGDLEEGTGTMLSTVAKGKADGPSLFHMFVRAKKPKALLLYAHGLHEYAGRYKSIFQEIASHGYSVYAQDHLGHGKSEGTRAFFTVDQLVDDQLAFLDMILKLDHHQGIPVFMMGHSLGGLITILTMRRRPDAFAGALLSAPAVQAGDSVKGWEKLAARVLGKVVPKLGISPLPTDTLLRVPETLDKYLKDPMIYHGAMRAGPGSSILNSLDEIAGDSKFLDACDVPLLALHGMEDRLTNPVATKNMVEKWPNADKVFRGIENAFHEIFFEPEGDEVLRYVVEFMDEHL